MDHDSQLNLGKNFEIVSTMRSETRTKVTRGLMTAAIVSIVALAVIAEARLTPEETFVNCCGRI